MTPEQQHISQPLAKFLKDNGFEKGSLYWWDIEEDKLVYFGENSEPKNDYIPHRFLPAYSWLDILVTYAVEIFGEEEITIIVENEYGRGELMKETLAYQHYPQQILSLLQHGKVAEAENIVREQFINKK